MRTWSRSLLPAVVALLTLAPAAWAAKEGKDLRVDATPGGARTSSGFWALVVGIDQYENPEISRLNYAVADAKAFARALVERAGYPADQVKVMTSDAQEFIDRPTHVNVIKRLDYLATKVGPEDTFAFFFSGHGYQKEGGRHFLGTVNADPSSVETLEVTSVPLPLLQQKMKKIKASRVIFFVDACRNDPEKGRGDGANTMSGGFAQGLQMAAASGASGLAGSAVFFACCEGERAFEWQEKGHGVFSYYLLEGMAGKAVDPGGELTMTTLGDYVQQQVLRWGQERGKQQKPELHQQGAAKIALGRSAGTPAGPGGEGGTVQTVETTATLEITSEPAGAKVLVDDVEQGQTPCQVKVELGVQKQKAVEVALTLDGYNAAVRQVTLVRGKSTPVKVTLVRAPARPSPAKPEPARPTPTKPEPAKPTPTKPQPPKELPGKNYADPGGAFALRIPQEWGADRTPLENVGWMTHLATEDEEGAQMIVMVIPSMIDLDPNTLEPTAALLINLVLGVIQQEGAVVSQKSAKTRFNDLNAVRCDVTYREEQGGPLFKGSMYVVLGKRNAVLVAVAAPQAEPAALARGERYLATFALESSKPRAAGAAGSGGSSSGAGLLGRAGLLACAAQRFKKDLVLVAGADVLADGDPPLTNGSVTSFLALVTHCFGTQFTEAEVEVTRQRFVEFYKKGDDQGKAMIAQGGKQILDQLKQGTAEEQAANKEEVRQAFAQRFSAGAAAGIEWAVALNEAIQRRENTLATSTAEKPRFAQQADMKSSFTEADLEAAMEMLYFMWVAAGRDAALVTPEAVAVVRTLLVQGFPQFPAEMQYLLTNAEKIYAQMRTGWVQATPAMRAGFARQFGQALDAMGLTVPRPQHTGSAWDDVDPSNVTAGLVQTTCWNLAQKASR